LLLKFHSSANWVDKIANLILREILLTQSLEKKIQFNLMPITKHYFQFKNGAFNLKTGILEKRTKEMYITETLDYNWLKSTCDDRIMKILCQILPDEKFREAALRWRGYCLTGDTKEQKFVLNVGETACNGKSTQSMIFEKCFPLYCKKIGNDTFNKGGQKFDKAVSKLANKPVRLVYMEEWGEEAQDTNKIKETIGSSTITCQPIWQEEIEMEIQFKLEAGSNYNPNTKNDNGLLRRGRKFEYNSRFVDTEDVDEDNHMYLKDENLLDIFDDDKVKSIYFNMVAPYAKLYYNEGLILPEECKTMFQEACEEGDVWVDFLDEFEISMGNDIHKDDMVNIVKEYFNLPTITAVECKREFKKRGFKYDSQKQKYFDTLDWKNEKNGKKERKKGYFVNIKRTSLIC